jgi:hypothetical protein
VSGSYGWMYRRTFVVRQVVYEIRTDDLHFTDVALTKSLLEDRNPDKKILWHDREDMLCPFPSRMKDRFRPQCSYKQLQTGYVVEGTTGDRVNE